jgi:NAD(P)-dependent dehydrogenase (short-subunit alcohol dehydrogenase family)
VGDSRPTTHPDFREWAVVVGAHGAFGTAIVGRLRAAGLGVLAVARNAESLARLATTHGAGVVPCVADVSDDAAIEAIRRALDAPVRMLVHAPGVPVAGGILEATTAAIGAAVDIKVNGLLRLVRAADDRLVAGGRIVAIGGHYGFEPTAYAAAPGIANAAIANLVRQLSWAYGPRGVTAHLIAPGPADTERLRRIAERRAASEGLTPEQFLADMNRESAIGRLTTPDQVAWAVAMLLAPQADALAGSSLMLDSGRRRGLP